MAYNVTKTGRLLAVSAIIFVLVLACAASANGQVTVGEKFKMLMNGNLGAVYAGNFGNVSASSHSLGL